jgi:hypothetical protein
LILLDKSNLEIFEALLQFACVITVTTRIQDGKHAAAQHRV